MNSWQRRGRRGHRARAYERHADERCVTEVAQVVSAANLATLDFQPWPSRRRATELPDEPRVDVDPQPGTSFADGEKIAGLVHEVRSEIGYTGWPKTSGNRGIHVLCRIEPTWGFPLCAAARSRSRGRSSAARRSASPPPSAGGAGQRVFIDFNQNARDRTIAASAVACSQGIRLRRS